MNFQRYYFLSVAIIVSFAQIALAQRAPKVEWQHCYGGSDFENFEGHFALYSHTLVRTEDGYAFLATTISNDSDVNGNHTYHGFATQDMWLVKTDFSGAIHWQKCLGGTATETAQCLIYTSDGGFIVCGETNSHDSDVTEPYTDSIIVNYETRYRRPKIEGWVVKLDSIGAVQWARCVGSHTGDEYLSSVCEVADGFVACGWTNAQEEDWQIHVLNPTDSFYNRQFSDALVVKLNLKGELVYHRLLGGTKGDGAYSVAPASDGCCFAGATSSNDFDVSGHHGYNGDVWIVRLDAVGRIRWQKCFGGANAEQPTCIINTPTGYMIAGWTKSKDGDVSGNHGQEPWGIYGKQDAWVFTIDTNGTLLNQHCFGGASDTDIIYSIIPSEDGNYVFAGSTKSTDGDVTGLHRALASEPDSTDGWVGEFSPDLQLLWQKCLGGTGNDGFGSVIETSDGGFLLNGITETMDNGDVSGNHPGKGVPQLANRVSDVWNVKLNSPYAKVAQESRSDLLDLYPNPARDVLHVEAFGSVQVLDALGRTYAIPNHDGTLDVSRLAAGVYYILLKGSTEAARHARFVKE
jgi:hypothetical protein